MPLDLKTLPHIEDFVEFFGDTPYLSIAGTERESWDSYRDLWAEVRSISEDRRDRIEKYRQRAQYLLSLLETHDPEASEIENLRAIVAEPNDRQWYIDCYSLRIEVASLLAASKYDEAHSLVRNHLSAKKKVV